jgi:hypothetical protein
VFIIPGLQWQPRAQSSLDSIVQQATAALQGNPKLAQNLGWDLSYNAMTDRVDELNAKLCLTMGWNDYVAEAAGEPPPPKLMAPQHNQSKLQSVAAATRKIWSGAKTLNEWLDSGEPAVAQEQSERRAATCTACPLNGQGDLSSWFTAPAAEMIRRQIERLEVRKLTTSHDAKLNVCNACLCPLKLKIHTPMKFIRKYLTPEVISDLRKGNACWIITEMKV